MTRRYSGLQSRLNKQFNARIGKFNAKTEEDYLRQLQKRSSEVLDIKKADEEIYEDLPQVFTRNQYRGSRYSSAKNISSVARALALLLATYSATAAIRGAAAFDEQEFGVANLTDYNSSQDLSAGSDASKYRHNLPTQGEEKYLPQEKKPDVESKKSFAQPHKSSQTQALVAKKEVYNIAKILIGSNKTYLQYVQDLEHIKGLVSSDNKDLEGKAYLIMDKASVKMCQENKFVYKGAEITYYDFIKNHSGVQILMFEDLLQRIGKFDLESLETVKSPKEKEKITKAVEVLRRDLKELYKFLTDPFKVNFKSGSKHYFPAVIVADFLKMMFLLGSDSKDKETNFMYDIDLFNGEKSRGALDRLEKDRKGEGKKEGLTVALVSLFVDPKSQKELLEINKDVLPKNFAKNLQHEISVFQANPHLRAIYNKIAKSIKSDLAVLGRKTIDCAVDNDEILQKPELYFMTPELYAGEDQHQEQFEQYEYAQSMQGVDPNKIPLLRKDNELFARDAGSNNNIKNISKLINDYKGAIKNEIKPELLGAQNDEHLSSILYSATNMLAELSTSSDEDFFKPNGDYDFYSGVKFRSADRFGVESRREFKDWVQVSHEELKPVTASNCKKLEDIFATHRNMMKSYFSDREITVFFQDDILHELKELGLLEQFGGKIFYMMTVDAQKGKINLYDERQVYEYDLDVDKTLPTKSVAPKDAISVDNQNQQRTN